LYRNVKKNKRIVGILVINQKICNFSGNKIDWKLFLSNSYCSFVRSLYCMPQREREREKM